MEEKYKKKPLAKYATATIRGISPWWGFGEVCQIHPGPNEVQLVPTLSFCPSMTNANERLHCIWQFSRRGWKFGLRCVCYTQREILLTNIFLKIACRMFYKPQIIWADFSMSC